MTYATIQGFELLNAQTVFDMSKEHLLKQGRASVIEPLGCRYRSGKGLMCAAGIFLRPEATAECEGMGWLTLRNEGMVPSKHSELVGDLQLIHDNTPPDDWKAQLKALAAERGLVYND